jgi:hypothetical protein
MIADLLNVDEFTVHEIVVHDFSTRKLCAKMVPKNLNDDLKACRNEVSAGMTDRLETESDLLTRVMTSDESWFLACDTETKRHSEEWHTPQSPTQKKARKSKSKTKTMVIIFFQFLPWSS